MTDPRLKTWAKALVGYSVDVKPGQTVAILGETAGEPLHRAIFAEVVARGGYPVLLPTYAGLGALMMGQGSDDQLQHITPVERFIRSDADVIVNVLAETNTKAMSGVDPARQQVFKRRGRS